MKTSVLLFIISRQFLLRMKNVSDKRCTENQNTIFYSEIFFPPENRVIYELMWKNIVATGKPQTTVWRMRIEYWIHETTDTS